jgi:hypothetical protein
MNGEFQPSSQPDDPKYWEEMHQQLFGDAKPSTINDQIREQLIPEDDITLMMLDPDPKTLLIRGKDGNVTEVEIRGDE